MRWRSVMTWLVLGAAMSSLACDSSPPATTGGVSAPANQAGLAPDVELNLHDGSKTMLSQLRGSMVLLYFYPKDDTPG